MSIIDANARYADEDREMLEELMSHTHDFHCPSCHSWFRGIDVAEGDWGFCPIPGCEAGKLEQRPSRRECEGGCSGTDVTIREE